MFRMMITPLIHDGFNFIRQLHLSFHVWKPIIQKFFIQVKYDPLQTTHNYLNDIVFQPQYKKTSLIVFVHLLLRWISISNKCTSWNCYLFSITQVGLGFINIGLKSNWERAYILHIRTVYSINFIIKSRYMG